MVMSFINLTTTWLVETCLGTLTVYTQKRSDGYTQKRSGSAGCSTGCELFIDSFIACSDFFCLRITLANSLEPVQD